MGNNVYCLMQSPWALNCNQTDQKPGKKSQLKLIVFDCVIFKLIGTII